MNLNKMSVTRVILVFAAVFAVSGFSGLIYESIWTHYLKLYLGHAAYAQTLVLTIFMGGMAIGAWIASFAGSRWKNLLIVYALVEAIIGVLALVFHESYDVFLRMAYSTILPSIDSVYGVQVFKWLSAALLILPQTILLGMTFPLMTAGIIRHAPEAKGRVLAVYYFANSMGASIGVLVSGFLLVDWFGLPGTIKTAGLLNIAVALLVISLVKKYALTAAPATNVVSDTDSKTSDRLVYFYLLLAFATGMASFIYEVSWIRMLSLVLGSSTHAFEMMLSAFIFGLAIGSFWLRNRIDRLKQEVKFLAYVQLLMGFFALLTLPLYNSVFDMMQWVVTNVDKTEQGYVLFNISSHALALLVMLPTTFCAGLTLPLITHLLIKSGYGEKSIGNVYAFNTVGAIIGVLLTIHWLMPAMGLKNSLAVGAVIDIVLGILILARYLRSGRQSINSRQFIPAGVAVICLLVTITVVEFNSYKMASGVYRHGNFYSPDNAELLFHKDGKTASIDLVRVKTNNEISIITNGKPDASINVSFSGVPSPDEATMVLAAALPLSIKPDSRQAAVIGLGSGLTSHVLLSAGQLDSVDTIEIEPAIVEAAKGFQPRVSNVYNSSKSHIYIDDAKSYFSTHNKKYDLIISEPSNPWVSGVANLFTKEFYQLVSNYLVEGGVFAQWLQLYEIDMTLVASVLKAMSQQFDDYAIYAANNNDIIIMARNHSKIGSPSENVFRSPMLARELSRVRVQNIQDLLLRKIGDKQYLDPLFQSYDIRYNSDYYPVLDLRAIKARFFQRDAMQIITLVDDPVNSYAILSNVRPPQLQTSITPSRFYYPADLGYAAMIIRDLILNNRIDRQFYKLPEAMKQSVMNMRAMTTDCNAAVDEQVLHVSLAYIARSISPYLAPAELTAIWTKIQSSPCASQFVQSIQQRLALNIAISNADAQGMSQLSEVLLSKNSNPKDQLLYAGMLGHLGLGQKQQAGQLWDTYASQIHVNAKSELLARLLNSHARQSQSK